MSYILDALKKADAERERGSVPGLHSQPTAPAPDDEPEGPQRPVAPALWIAGGAGLCLIAVLSWQLLTRAPISSSAPSAPSATPPAIDIQTTEASAQPPTARPETSPAVSNMPNMPNTAPYPSEPVQARTRPAEPPARSTQKPRSDAVLQPARTPDAQMPAPTSRIEPSNNSKPTPQTSSTAPQIPTLQALPDDVRRDIPPLTIGGAMYSETPASRMLIINSQVFHEGDKPYQGLTLEEIRLKSAVFSYRGYRYLVNY